MAAQESWPVTRPIYRCPKCNGLLQVVHDIEALKDRSGPAWMKLFDDRYPAQPMAVRLGRLGQARVGHAAAAGRHDRVRMRRHNQYEL